MEFDFEHVNELLAFAKDTILIVAAIIGGVWAYFKFVVGGRDWIAVEMSMDVNVGYNSSDDYYFLNTIVTIKNRGAFPAPLVFEGRKPFLVAPVQYDQKGEEVYEHVELQNIAVPLIVSGSGMSQNVPITQSMLGTESEVKYTFLTRVKKPGLYFVRFSIPIPKVKLTLLGVRFRIKSPSDPTLAEWSTEKYVLVHENQKDLNTDGAQKSPLS